MSLDPTVDASAAYLLRAPTPIKYAHLSPLPHSVRFHPRETAPLSTHILAELSKLSSRVPWSVKLFVGTTVSALTYYVYKWRQQRIDAKRKRRWFEKIILAKLKSFTSNTTTSPSSKAANAAAASSTPVQNAVDLATADLFSLWYLLMEKDCGGCLSNAEITAALKLKEKIYLFASGGRSSMNSAQRMYSLSHHLSSQEEKDLYWLAITLSKSMTMNGSLAFYLAILLLEAQVNNTNRQSNGTNKDAPFTPLNLLYRGEPITNIGLCTGTFSKKQAVRVVCESGEVSPDRLKTFKENNHGHTPNIDDIQLSPLLTVDVEENKNTQCRQVLNYFLKHAELPSLSSSALPIDQQTQRALEKQGRHPREIECEGKEHEWKAGTVLWDTKDVILPNGDDTWFFIETASGKFIVDLTYFQFGVKGMYREKKAASLEQREQAHKQTSTSLTTQTVQTLSTISSNTVSITSNVLTDLTRLVGRTMTGLYNILPVRVQSSLSAITEYLPVDATSAFMQHAHVDSAFQLSSTNVFQALPFGERQTNCLWDTPFTPMSTVQCPWIPQAGSIFELHNLPKPLIGTPAQLKQVYGLELRVKEEIVGAKNVIEFIQKKVLINSQPPNAVHTQMNTILFDIFNLSKFHLSAHAIKLTQIQVRNLNYFVVNNTTSSSNKVSLSGKKKKKNSSTTSSASSTSSSSSSSSSSDSPSADSPNRPWTEDVD